MQTHYEIMEGTKISQVIKETSFATKMDIIVNVLGCCP